MATPDPKACKGFTHRDNLLIQVPVFSESGAVSKDAVPLSLSASFAGESLRAFPQGNDRGTSRWLGPKVTASGKGEALGPLGHLTFSPYFCRPLKPSAIAKRLL
jgi:hypothetical protein